MLYTHWINLFPSPLASCLVLTSLHLTQFKNYASLALEFSPRLNCFTGLNGMGKTNVLDAIHFLCLSRSHGPLLDQQLIQHDTQFLRLEALFDHDGERSKVVVKLANRQRKVIERNGVPFARIADYVGKYPVVMIAPEDVALVQEGSEERRRFLDVTLSQMSGGYLRNLMVYNALLKQRNALLKAVAEEVSVFDPALLESIDHQMPEPARVVAEGRAQFMQQFLPLFLEYYAAISASHESVSIRYDAQLLPGDNLLDALKGSRARDLALGRTSSGPHRDELRLEMDQQPVRKFASQGQIKSYLLAMRLAQYEVLRQQIDTPPILLLDDIFDKLDEHRVRQLIGLLLARDFGQVFITDTQRGRLEHIVSSFTGEYRMFEVENGTVRVG